MRWLLRLVLVLAAVVAVVAAVGAALPQQHVAVRSARIRERPLNVWQTITDFPSEPSWLPTVKAVERLADRDGHAVWREVDSSGESMSYETVEFVPPRRLVRRIAEEGLPFGGTWTIEITEVDDGCVVTIMERGEVYNPIFRFVARFVIGYTASIDAYLKALGRRFGEDVVPTTVDSR